MRKLPTILTIITDIKSLSPLLTEYNSDQWTVNGVWNSTNKQELIERRKKIIPVKPLQQNNEENKEMILEIAQLKQQLREKDTTIQQKEAAIQQKDTIIRQQQQQTNEQLRQKDTVIREKENAIHRQEQQLREKDAIIQEKTTTLDQSNHLIQEKDGIIQRNVATIAEQQRVIQRYRDNPHWVIQRDEVTITQNTLGRGGWGEVKVGIFRGTKVAVKRLYQEIQSEYNMELFAREVNIASRIRHPNLLQFIGATRDGDLLIVTELMQTSLRDELQKNKLPHSQVIAIAIDIITGLNYLHKWRPRPILHRDVSSANVLLQPLANSQWKAKLSDYGSVNLQDHIKTANPGSPVYSAPESNTPALHSPAMDIFSFGILLAEMATRRLPSSTVYEREAQIREVKWPTIRLLIARCTVPNRNTRPSTDNVLNQLEELYSSEFNYLELNTLMKLIITDNSNNRLLDYSV